MTLFGQSERQSGNGRQPLLRETLKAKRHLRVYEVGISYWGRTYEEGKKIGWKDGIRAVWCLFKYAVKKLPAQNQNAIRSDSQTQS